MPRSKLRIVVGIDFSRESLAALRGARSLAARCGGRVTLVHVRPESDLRAAVVEDRGDLLSRDEPLGPALERHYIRRLERACRPTRAERVLLLRGIPWVRLCRQARRDCDLLVVGGRGRGSVARFLLGSTVQGLLSRSPVPVVVVRGGRTG